MRLNAFQSALYYINNNEYEIPCFLLRANSLKYFVLFSDAKLRYV